MQIDVRGPRFSAALTTVVLAVAFLLRSPWVLGLQVVVFAVGSIAGLRWSPYGNVFRFLKRRLDLGPPPDTEPEAGPRFSQTLGFIVSGAGLGLVVAGVEVVGWALVLAVLALSGLLALTGLCVGCELYGLGQRLRRSDPT